MCSGVVCEEGVVGGGGRRGSGELFGSQVLSATLIDIGARPLCAPRSRVRQHRLIAFHNLASATQPIDELVTTQHLLPVTCIHDRGAMVEHGRLYRQITKPLSYLFYPNHGISARELSLRSIIPSNPQTPPLMQQ